MISIAEGTSTWGDTLNSALDSCKNGASYVVEQGKEWGSYLIEKASELATKIYEFAQPFFQDAMNFVSNNSEAFTYGALALGGLGLSYVVYTRYIRAAPAEATAPEVAGTPVPATGTPVPATGTPVPTR